MTHKQYKEQNKRVILTFDCSTIRYNENNEKYTITFRDGEMKMHEVIMNKKSVQTKYDFSIPEPDRSNKFVTEIDPLPEYIQPSKPKPKVQETKPQVQESSENESKQPSAAPEEAAASAPTKITHSTILFEVVEQFYPDLYSKITPLKVQISTLDLHLLKKSKFLKDFKSLCQVKGGPATKIFVEFKRRVDKWLQDPIYWMWMGEHGLGPYDPSTQTQIEEEYQNLIALQKSGSNYFTLSEGPWFGLIRNKGKYVIDIDLDFSESIPIMKKGRQRNINSKFTRPIERIPPMLSSSDQAYYSEAPAFWMWKDNDHHLWQHYHWETNKQIEEAFTKKKEDVQLTHGWFGKKSGYYVKFSYQSTPGAGQQVNRNSGFSRRVRRVTKDFLLDSARKSMPNAGIDNVGKSYTSDINDWRDQFRALSNSEFQRILHAANSSAEKDGLKCTICQEVFVEKELLQRQKPEECKRAGVVDDTNNNNNLSVVDPVKSLDVEWAAVMRNKLKDILKTHVFAEVDEHLPNIAPQVNLERFQSLKKIDFNKVIKKFTNSAKTGPLGKVYGGLKEQHLRLYTELKKIQHTHDDSLLELSNEIADATIISLMSCVPGHYFHAACIAQALANKRQCPNCQTIYGIVTGPQPVGFFSAFPNKKKCAGHLNCGTIQMIFEFPDGVQSNQHQSPGKGYMGDFRLAFVPNNAEGREAMCLTRLAFERRLLFTVGRSLTNKKDNQIIFQSIHLKTRWDGGKQNHGYPDDDYFTRLKEELLPKGITIEQLNDENRKFIAVEWKM